ncbi:uL15 family ribosomal protein [Candidatus Woesearchaeota archaeon]|nr:uL15 family ribosomal protein [Candidatus Woesearchaeota archaeon]
MVVRMHKKNVKQRGKNSHGWGGKSRHRGAGNRGGRGMAGSGKRAHHKKQSILKTFGNEYYGRHGFTSLKNKKSVVVKSINLGEIEKKIHKFGKKEGDYFVINLKEQGYDKLLGTGNVKNKLKIICNLCSANAKEKIEKAGGEIVA